MRLMPVSHVGLLLTSLTLMYGQTASAVILRDSATRNTSAPTGILAGSGWQFEGQWVGFTGTPISPNYFVTAAHVGGSVGDLFSYNGQSYTTIGVSGDAGSDLAVWQVRETFSTYAPLYTGSNETNKQAVIFGRGTPRGNEVHIPEGDTSTTSLRGWGWGLYDGVPSWGENKVASIATGSGGNGPRGDFLVLPFSTTGAGASSLSLGDSGGGTFINDGGVWKLAGVNYGVDGPYSYTSGGNYFNGAIFDKRGLFEGGPGSTNGVPNYIAYPNSGPPVESDSYATRISTRLAWINSATNGQVVPEPGAWLLLTVGLSLVLGTRLKQRRTRRAVT